MKDPPEGHKRLKKNKKNEGQVLFVISNCHTAQFFCPLSILPLSLRHMTVAWFLWEKWAKLTDFDYFDWKLVVTFTCQECLVKQIVNRFRCPSDLINFVKICAFVQPLEAILECVSPNYTLQRFYLPLGCFHTCGRIDTCNLIPRLTGMVSQQVLLTRIISVSKTC